MTVEAAPDRYSVLWLNSSANTRFSLLPAHDLCGEQRCRWPSPGARSEIVRVYIGDSRTLKGDILHVIASDVVDELPRGHVWSSCVLSAEMDLRTWRCIRSSVV